MREFKKHKSRRGEIVTFCIQAMGILLLLCVAAVAVRAAWGMYVKLTRATAGQEAAEVQLAALKAQQAEVAASVAELSSERGVEAQIRQRFGVAKQGEGEIEIMRDSGATSSAPKEPESWWRGVFRALFVW
jgi:cell division protein FtsB